MMTNLRKTLMCRKKVAVGKTLLLPMPGRTILMLVLLVLETLLSTMTGLLMSVATQIYVSAENRTECGRQHKP